MNRIDVLVMFPMGALTCLAAVDSDIAPFAEPELLARTLRLVAFPASPLFVSKKGRVSGTEGRLQRVSFDGHGSVSLKVVVEDNQATFCIPVEWIT